MIAGLDIGGTNTQAVLMDGRKIIAKTSVPRNSLSAARKCIDYIRKHGNPEKVAVTGGGARKLSREILGSAFTRVDEMDAIGKGGMFLSGRKDIFVVSLGTGTAFVSARNGRSEHVGGTAMGGGTIMGLSSIMTGGDPDHAEKLSRKGDRKLDLTVGEIVGGPIGRIPEYAIASNFGKARKGAKKSDVSLSLLNMIAESIGVTAYFAAKSHEQEKRILICGRVAVNCVIKKRIIQTVKVMGGKAHIPENAEYCGALGAALSV